MKKLLFLFFAASLFTVGANADDAGSIFDRTALWVSGGRTYKSSDQLHIKARGGAGWYWADGVDFTPWGSINAEFSQPTSALLTFQVLYGDGSVADATVAAGSSTFSYAITDAFKNVYSVNIISTDVQNVYLKRMFVKDKDGNELTGISAIGDNPSVAVATEYFNMAGQHINAMQHGVNILRVKMSDGRTITKKITLK